MSELEEAPRSHDSDGPHEQAAESLRMESSKAISILSSFSNKSCVEIVRALKKSYTDLPVTQAAVGTEESLAITNARSELTSNLVLYNKFLLPLSNVLVNDLRMTLGYFTDDYETFKALLEVVREEVKESEERAVFVHEAYVKLATDLRKLAEEANRNLEAAKLAVKSRQTEVNSKAKSAKKWNKRAVGMGVAGFGAGAWMALGLLGPGGLLFAPAYAGTAFIGNVIAGGIAGAVAGSIGEDYSMEAKKLQVVSDQLKASGEVCEKVFMESIDDFADCMQHFAKFFNAIGNQIKLLDKRLDRIDPRQQKNYSDTVLQNLYKLVKKEADPLLKACDRYDESMVGVKIDIGLLERFEESDYWSYIDEWFNDFPSQKTNVSIVKFVNKAVPDLKNAPKMLKSADTSVSMIY